MHLLDDTPVVPGDTRPAYNNTHHARQVLNDAEDDLRDWRAEPEPESYGAAPEEESIDKVAAKDADEEELDEEVAEPPKAAALKVEE